MILMPSMNLTMGNEEYFIVVEPNVPQAFRMASPLISKQERVIYSLPHVLRLRGLVPKEESERHGSFHPLWRYSYVCASDEIIGKSEQGSPILIEVHGCGIITLEKLSRMLFKAQNLRLEGAIPVQESDVRNLLRGILPDGTEIPVLSYTELYSETISLPERYAVVMGLDVAQASAKGRRISLEVLRENPLFIARTGGITAANAYLDLEVHPYSRVSEYSHMLSLPTAYDLPHGRLLEVCGYSLGGIKNRDNLGTEARVLVGPVQARRAVAEVPLIEALVNVQLPRSVYAAMQRGLPFEFGGRRYEVSLK